jgi:protein dithiol oxidoreductase (disulfide-forming)
MRRLSFAFLSAALLTLGSMAQAATFEAGRHYAVLPQAQRTHVAPGKVEVMEVFSYGCPACNHFRPLMQKLKQELPPNAQMVYLPASWNAAEAWPLFQRAYLTAQSLGVADKAHEAMFDAIWTTGELGVADKATNQLKRKEDLPKIEDAARFYQRVTGVKAADFVAASKSFGVDLKVRQADRQINDMQVTGTPTLVVNGKYRVNNDSVKSGEELIAVVKFLVAKESAAAPAAPAAPAKKPG